MILTGVMLSFWMIIIPFCCGIPIARKFSREGRYLEMTFLSGYLVVISAVQVLYLGFVIWYNHFVPLVWTAGIFLVGFALFSFFRWGKFYIGSRNAGRIKKTRVEVLLWIVFGLLLSVQLYMTIFYAYPDGDDAFYTVTSLITDTSQNMYINIPYTGETSVLDKRHAFSSAPIFMAFLGRVCGVHPTVMTNLYFSCIVVILTYMIYKMIAVRLFEGGTVEIPLFMIFISIIYLFGNSTIYQSTTFLLTRTGQGKAFLSNIVPLAIILALLHIVREMPVKVSVAPWVFLSLAMVTAGYTSTMGMFLAPMLAGGGIIVVAIRYHTPRVLLYYAVSVLPLGIMGILYLINVYFT